MTGTVEVVTSLTQKSTLNIKATSVIYLEIQIVQIQIFHLVAAIAFVVVVAAVAAAIVVVAVNGGGDNYFNKKVTTLINQSYFGQKYKTDPQKSIS